MTASKTGASTVMETPLSIQAISADSLERANALEFNDFAKAVPGVSMMDRGPSNKRYVIRGVNTPGSVPTASTVGVYMDEMPLTSYGGTANGGFQIDPALLDLERVEVLKGPQGTAFGSGSMAGVVRYITNKPDTTAFSGTVRAGVSSRESGDTGWDGSLTLNVPLVTDKLALRGTVYSNKQPGYIDNRYEKDFNDYQVDGYRIAAKWQITDAAELIVFSTHQEGEGGGMGILNRVDFQGNPVRKLYASNPERTPFNDSYDIHNATLNIETSLGVFTATGAVLDRDAEAFWPASQAVAAGLGVPVSDADQDGVRSTITNDVDQQTKSAEVRFASDLGGRFNFLVGAYYATQEALAETSIYTTNDRGYIDPAAGIRFGGTAQERYSYAGVEELAAFGQIMYDITDKLKLTAGARVFKFDLENQGTIVTQAWGVPGSGKGELYKGTEESAIGRVNLSYSLDSGGVVYADISQGYRPGGANDRGLALLGGVSTIPEIYKSDDIISYELGYKSSFLDRRLNLATSAYYIDWSDLQLAMRTPITPSTPISYGFTGNAGAARIYGAEIELQARPVAGLDLSLTLGYTNARLAETTSAGGVDGDRLPYVPELTGAFSADYTFPITSSIEAFVGADFLYVDEQTTELPNQVSTYRVFESYTLTNVRFGVDFGSVSASILCKNLFNDDSRIGIWKPNGPGIDSYMINAPRTVSLQVVANF